MKKQSVILACVLLLTCSVSYAREWYIDASSPYSVIIDPVPGDSWETAFYDLANVCMVAQSNDIVYVTNGTYYGYINITNDIKVIGVGNREDIILDGLGTNRVLKLNGGTNVVVENFTIQNGWGDRNRYSSVYIDEGTVRNCTIKNCTSGTNNRGAGVFLEDPDCYLENCIIENCDKALYGGGIFAWDGVIKDCVVRGNHAQSGGGMWLGGPVVVEHCIITNNYTGNTGAGGGLRLKNGANIRNCIVAGNRASKGGGVFCLVGDVVIENCTVVENIATATNGVGGVEQADKLVNNIVWNNRRKNGQVDEVCNYSLAGAGSVVAFNCISPADTNFCNVDKDPDFIWNNGTGHAWGRYKLRCSSPCIDSGEDLYAVGVTNDFAKLRRPRDGDHNGSEDFDIGAFEYDPVTTDSDDDGSTDEDEYVAGTDPTNEVDVLEITDMDTSSTNGIAFTWYGKNGKTYTVYYRINLSQGWNKVPGATNIPGRDAVISWTNTAPGHANFKFYRIGVQNGQ